MFTVGHNVAGFLPDNEPDTFDNYADAVEYLKIDMREYADGNDDMIGEEFDEVPTMLAHVDALLRDDGPPFDASQLRNGHWSCLVEDGFGRMIAFWLAVVEPVTERYFPGVGIVPVLTDTGSV